MEGVSCDGAGTHGYDDPLKVSDGGLFTNVGKQFLDVAAAFDKERGQLTMSTGYILAANTA